ncbi:bestrophin-like domain [Peredibacter starrii]|uniref:DUF4239 domain-containing protein n=1 Tax=Peredibacter starrii TaxID=28202 RepID=A0AAX4HJJ0_9BACT|nr:hypothetical protein [Peredibacter starrii]WPU63204.1 hypothetical protein SOO65_10960 [Peredibacter starrii]
MWGKRVRESSPLETFKVSEIITTSSFAMLSLILGFTYSMAVSRFELRRKLVIDEANAISSTYLRGKIIHVDAAKYKQLYRRYLDLRIESYDSYDNPERMAEIKKETGLIQKEIFTDFEVITLKNRGALESAYLYAMTDMFDSEFERSIALDVNLPPSIYMIILMIAIVTIGMLNYDRGYSQKESHWAMTLFIIVFAVIVCFIHDLDHPHTGAVQISQEALLMLRNSWVVQ